MARRGRSTAGALAIAAIVGLAVGCATSYGQAHLSGTLNPLVNSASAWLVAPFFVGALLRKPSSGALAGLLTCALQVVGYFVTSELRGFPTSSSSIAFWTACAVVGGPLFGAGGHLWRRGRRRLAAPSSTLLPAVFLAEGIWIYGIQLGYFGATVLWLAIGSVLAVALPRRLGALRWLPATTAVGIAGEVLLTQVHSQAF